MDDPKTNDLDELVRRIQEEYPGDDLDWLEDILGEVEVYEIEDDEEEDE